MKHTENKHMETPQKPEAQTGFAGMRPEAAEGWESSRLAELEMENRRLNRFRSCLIYASAASVEHIKPASMPYPTTLLSWHPITVE
jgi:hypothetical protein